MILLSVLGNLTTIAVDLVKSYGSPMLAFLMFLESSSIPVPSEVILPLAGALAARHILSFWIAYIAILIGSTLGLLLDYYIGFVVGKDVIYKHAKRLRISKESIERFDRWFDRNAVAAVFLSRLLPVVRTLMSFPAGFAKMPLRRFLFYSVAGSAIWDLMLMAFGLYAFSTNNAVIWLSSIGALAIVLYVIYRVAIGRLRG